MIEIGKKYRLKKLKGWFEKDSEEFAVVCFGEHNIVDLVEQYNKAMESAPIKLYHLYVLRYLKGCTQEDAANEIGFAVNSIQAMQNSLILWLCKNIQKDD